MSGSFCSRAFMKALTTVVACVTGDGGVGVVGAVATHRALLRTNTNVLESGAQTGRRKLPSASLVRLVPSGRSE